jgi:hypothetical protein
MHLCIPSTLVFTFDVLPGLLMYATFIALLIFWYVDLSGEISRVYSLNDKADHICCRGDIYVGYYDSNNTNTTVQEVTPLVMGKEQRSFITVKGVKRFILGIIVLVLLSIVGLFIAFAAINKLECKRGEPLMEPVVVYLHTISISLL